MSWSRRWGARWIWLDDPSVKRWVAPEDRARPPDTVALFRRTFRLPRVPGSVPGRLTADGRYQAWVNGARVGWGPARGEPAHLRFDEYDLAPHLEQGENVIAVVVRHYGEPVPYWKPAARVGDLGSGGLLFEALIDGDPIVSDASWRCRFAPYERAHVTGRFGRPPVEIVDGRKYPWDWTEPGFDDASWDGAVELDPLDLGVPFEHPPTDPFGMLERNELAPLSERVVRPIRLIGSGKCGGHASQSPLDAFALDAFGEGLSRIADDTQIPVGEWRTFDFGEIVNGYPILELDAEPGTIIDLACGEDLADSKHPVVAPRDWTMRYTAAGRAGEQVEALDPVGFRYLQSAVRTGAVRSIGLSARYRHYPRPEGAYFSCDDPVLEEIWRVGAATLDACSTDAFIDCPGREQRAWVGDAYVETLVSLVCNPDCGLVRWNIELLGQGVRADGLLPMVAGGDVTDFAATIPDFSLHWVRTIARIWEHLAELESLERLMPRALGVVNWFERHRSSDGLLTDLTGWVWIDWAQTERRRQVAAADALYTLASTDAAMLAEALGDDGTARRLRSRADESREAFERYWDAERGVYVDAADPDRDLGRRVSQQTNVLAILSRSAPEDRWPSILDYIIDDERLVHTRHPGDGGPRPQRLRYQWMPAQEFGIQRPLDEEREVVLAQPFFCHFLHQALVAAGRRDLLFSSMRRWKKLVDRGNGVFEEYWDHVPGHGSRCHAWSATPTYDLSTHILGVRGATPGWTSVIIDPYFGPLERIEGGVPTPRGLVRVQLRRDGGGVIELPGGMSGTLLVDGGPVELVPGHQELPAISSSGA